MAAKSIQITNEEQAELALHRLGSIQRERRSMKSACDHTISAAREDLRVKSNPLSLEKRRLEAALERYAKADRKRWTQKSLKLVHGQFGFRKRPERLVLPKSEEKLLDDLRKHNLQRCIRTYEAPDREQLKLEADATLEAVGVRRRRGERFYVEPRTIPDAELDAGGEA